jgi:pyruvate dehydrogenase E1 component alpha subunit
MATAQASGASPRLRELGLDREDALQMYRHMLITRGVEERGHILFRQGKIPGSFYTGRGNEGASVGSAWAMQAQDWGTPLHRDMGVHITRGVEPWRIFAQYMARVDGPTKGRDGNVHLADARLGLIAMVSHLPAMLPVAVGCALAFRIRGEKDRCAFAWSGDGATARGDFHEGVNMAAVRKLPIVFIIDNNQWAYSTPQNLGFATDTVADRAKGYGIPGVQVDGTDVLASYEAVRAARDRAVAGEGPTVVELHTLRMEGHAVHDDAFYVPKKDFEEWAKKDPIERFRTFLQEHINFSDTEDEELRASVKKLLSDQLEKAEASPEPDPSTVTEGVFASPEELDNPHH